MSVQTYRENINGLYYITFTNYKWLHLFHVLNMYDEIYKWFNLLEKKKEAVAGYVIMPNHLHLLLFHKEENGNLYKIISNAKRFMSYEIVKRLKERKDFSTIRILSDGLTATDKKKGQKHRVFEDSFDCKRCYSEKFIEQKLNYIHNNPIHPKWNLSTAAKDYPHSSAALYSGKERKYPFKLQHYKTVQWELEDSTLK